MVGEEKECLILEYGAADYTTKIILLILRLWQMIVVREPVVGVQHAISEVLEQRAMKTIRSGARHDGNLPSGRASEFRGKRRGLDAKLLRRIHRHQAVGASRSAQRG